MCSVSAHDSSSPELSVEVVDTRVRGLAPPRVRHVSLPRGTRVADALAAADIDAGGIDLAQDGIGVWGELTTLDRPLSDGDRVEVYAGPRVDPRAWRLARLPPSPGRR